ncbi:CDGSH iron-sulfur domain-containing protein [Halorarius litoreus]|uniref:CDGSH iron-sulfur domain-containing protein n=1 Tax=Halorarius litoreus TaxID=2962676 RepID=UPI0020CE83FC|nr:CDGSH iron-sulfur domain-containing protein [Halorarius litoreus]
MREVTHTATGPLKLDEDDIDPEKGDIAVCLCGLSDDHPFCDGSHRATRDEEPGVRYKYDGDSDDGERRVVELVEMDTGEAGDADAD